MGSDERSSLRLVAGAHACAVEPRPEPLDLATLYRQLHDVLLQHLVGKLGSEDEARDVAQEAYLRMLDHKSARTVQHLRAYLFRTAENLAIDRLRERARRRERDNVDPLEAQLVCPEPLAERIVDGEQRIANLRRILTELPPKCRLAFMLHRFERLSPAQIAVRMGLTESMVRKYILRAVRHCLERLDRE